ncbi:UNVERIFIED_CONTAM: protein DMP9 [Sesamum calycinum]|uniref:Protein DMP9 n=1 Tax=Sesamum calycinum TaxID=2727403 RepID=A0AAW2R779_9LAMI
MKLNPPPPSWILNNLHHHHHHRCLGPDQRVSARPLSPVTLSIKRLIAFCAVICFLSSFTDSFTDSDGKLYYGIATFKGLYIFNSTTDHDEQLPESGGDVDKMNNSSTMDLSKFRISLIDFVHAFVSLLVFLAFAFSDSDVQSCFFAVGGADLDVLVVNLPLAAGVSPASCS